MIPKKAGCSLAAKFHNRSKLMKKILALLLTLSSLNAMAVLLEGKDLNGRLMVMDQSTGAVQGVVEVRKATGKDVVFGNVVVNVNQLVIKGKKLSGNCGGSFDIEEQTLTALCKKNTEVLSLKLSNSNEDIASYLSGSFLTAELSYGPTPVQSHAEKFTVNIKNLDMQ